MNKYIKESYCYFLLSIGKWARTTNLNHYDVFLDYRKDSCNEQLDKYIVGFKKWLTDKLHNLDEQK